MKKDHTAHRHVNENPCNMCMPMGGILPFKGMEEAMVIIHGSQGCSTYMRRHISEHFNEPIDVASSSLNEKGTVYGGEKNLKKGLDNLVRVYRPKVIGILTTCLAETIGEDIERIAAEYLRERQFPGLSLITVPTPGYGGTHAEGYYLAVRRTVAQLAKKEKKKTAINVLIPPVSPADIREIKRMLDLMGIEYVLFPDYADTLDGPFQKPYRKIPRGGTRREDLAGMADAAATIEMGITVPDAYSAGRFLEEEFGVPFFKIPLPIGVANTDTFLRTLREITGQKVPSILKQERGRLLDCMIDSHKYNFQGRSVIYGEPELTYALAGTCLENGVYPRVIATGSKTGKLKELLEPLLAKNEEQCVILSETDFSQIREQCRQMQVNVALGSSDGRYLTEREGIPLVRIGFPIHDRVGGQRLLSVGYQGTTLLLDRITNTLLEHKHKSYRASLYDKYYRPGAQKDGATTAAAFAAGENGAAGVMGAAGSGVKTCSAHVQEN